LQQELRRNDKAMAEVAALLIAPKKIQAYWGEAEGRADSMSVTGGLAGAVSMG
jgi:hypothetical protein